MQPEGVQTVGQAVVDALGSLEGQSSAARSYGRFRHRIKGNGRKEHPRISGRGTLKVPCMDGFLLIQELLKNSIE